jgi:hypothetical protein
MVEDTQSTIPQLLGAQSVGFVPQGVLCIKMNYIQEKYTG